MTRRMQPNARTAAYPHTAEHDEIYACRIGYPCDPKPVPVAPTVTVPIIGTVLVVDGVVQDIARIHPWRDGAITVTTKPPKPSFFEEGKTYKTSWGARFEVDCVRGDVAFGRYTNAADVAADREGRWTTLSTFEHWREV